ncbi:MAG: cellulase family glycosylhydrolase [Candidatus Riflebacteria bacterium]|nr:cellulase family glycosylhydrolase [Candidatus Riflebacteria bacterium]
MAFWTQQKKGVNQFCTFPTAEWWKSAKTAGVQFVRLTLDSDKNQVRDKSQSQTQNNKHDTGLPPMRSVSQDFLIGSADNYNGLVPTDLAKLREQLDLAQANNIKVVITMLSLPGCRGFPSIQQKSDPRLWQEHRFFAQAATFWRDLARECRNHPAVVGYDILHEPHPANIFLSANSANSADAAMQQAWENQIWGSLSDVNHLYKVIAASIRQVDPETPIILESDLFASPRAFAILFPLDDPKTLYSFHFYEPREFTGTNVNRAFSYPDKMPAPEGGATVGWDRKTFRQVIKPVIKWTQAHKIPTSRILVGDFGCNSHADGAKEYVSDAIIVFNALGYHWATQNLSREELVKFAPTGFHQPAYSPKPRKSGS